MVLMMADMFKLNHLWKQNIVENIIKILTNYIKIITTFITKATDTTGYIIRLVSLEKEDQLSEQIHLKHGILINNMHQMKRHGERMLLKDIIDI